MSTMRTKWSLIVLFVAQGSAFCPLLAPLPHLSRQTLANPQRQASTLHSLSTDYLENLDEECDISQVRVGERVYGTLKSNTDTSVRGVAVANFAATSNITSRTFAPLLLASLVTLRSSQPSLCAAGSNVPLWVDRANDLQERGLGSVFLLAATALSLTLANTAMTSARWLSFWAAPIGPAIGGHALSPQGWVNEGLMALFFFVVGLEIKLELRRGSLSSVRKAVLPCIAAMGGMIVPMLVYLLTTAFFGGGSLAAVTVPMATDIGEKWREEKRVDELRELSQLRCRF